MLSERRQATVSEVFDIVTLPMFVDSDSSSDDPIEERKLFIALNKDQQEDEHAYNFA